MRFLNRISILAASRGLRAHRGRTSSTTALASRQYREKPAGLALTGNVIDADPPARPPAWPTAAVAYR